MRVDFALTSEDYPVRPVRVYLTHAHFYDPEDTPPSFSERTGFHVSLELERPGPLNLVVALTVSTERDAPAQLTCTYAAEYEMNPAFNEELRDEMLTLVAYNLGPRLLYTYVREFITNVTARWRGEPLILPLSPLPITQGHDEIPPAPEDGSYQLPLIDEGEIVQEIYGN